VGLTWLHWAQWLPAALWLAREVYMGYQRKPKQYRLKFEDPDMEGFVCLAKSVSVDEFVMLTQLAGDMTGGRNSDLGQVFDLLAASIVEWNLEDEAGEPLKPTAEVIRAQDIDFTMAILMGWMDAIASVPSPLPGGSPNGGIPPEELRLGLASLSQSLPNSPKPG
jgi:hypothetical protein